MALEPMAGTLVANAKTFYVSCTIVINQIKKLEDPKGTELTRILKSVFFFDPYLYVDYF